MQQRMLINLLLLAAVALLGLLVFFEPGVTPEQAAQSISSLKASEVQSIRIQRQNLDDVLLEKRGQQWWVQHRDAWLPANQWRADTLSGLLQAKSLGSFAAPSDLQQYGLATPKARIRLNDIDIQLGDNEPLQRRRYLLIDGQVHLIADTFYQHLFALPADYISSKLLPENSQIKAIQLPAFSLFKDENKHWHSHGLAADRASGERIQQFIDEWQFAQAISVQENTQQQGERIKLQLQDSHIEFILQAPLLIRPDLGLAYEFSDDTLAKLSHFPSSN